MPDDTIKKCESDHDRIVRLETWREADKGALILAREIMQSEQNIFKSTTERHFEAVNNLQAKLDKQVEKFATKDDIMGLSKFMWTGIGVLLALELLLRFFVKA